MDSRPTSSAPTALRGDPLWATLRELGLCVDPSGMGPANDESTAVSQPPSSPVVSGGEEEADGPQSNGPPALRPDDLGRWIIAERG